MYIEICLKANAKGSAKGRQLHVSNKSICAFLGIHHIEDVLFFNQMCVKYNFDQNYGQGKYSKSC